MKSANTCEFTAQDYLNGIGSNPQSIAMLSTDNLLDPTLPVTVPVVVPNAAPVVELPPAELPQPTAVETIRVLHVINGEYYAGAERVQDLLAKHLPALGFSAGFACVKLDMFDELRDSKDSPLYDVPMVARFDLWAACRVAQIVRQRGYRIIHGHTVRTAMIGSLASALTGVPMVYHAHSPSSHDTTWRWWDRFNGFVERLSLRRASRVIAVSQAMAAHVEQEGFDPALIRVVPNGVPKLSTAPERRAPEGLWTLGVVALFRPRKGLEVLLDAMHILRRQGLPVHLRAVGTFESPKYEAEISARVRRLRLDDHITWTGFTRDVAEELQQMDLMVLPSLFGEGLPMVVLEAMASGVPVVATHVAGVPEAIRHGRDGVLVTPGDAEDLARAIADVVGGHYDWSALRASALARHAQCFSDRAMAEGVAGVYRELLGG
jgi:glycosyltransferase involved in cell wall biosynthesis